MLRVGLTGSIATGKSHVASVLRELGCHVIDADLTAREVVEKRSAGLSAVVNAFGPGILNPDGTLNRQRLGSIVFADRDKRTLLNSILHPLIIAAQNRELDALAQSFPGGIGVVDAALLVESGSYSRFDKLVVVHCDTEVQLERLMRRDGITHDEAAHRIAAQMPQEEKMKFADYLIDTSGGFAATRAQVMEVVRELRTLVRRRSGGADDSDVAEKV